MAVVVASCDQVFGRAAVHTALSLKIRAFFKLTPWLYIHFRSNISSKSFGFFKGEYREYLKLIGKRVANLVSWASKVLNKAGKWNLKWSKLFGLINCLCSFSFPWFLLVSKHPYSFRFTSSLWFPFVFFKIWENRSNEQSSNPHVTFHYTGGLIGTLIMVYDIIPIYLGSMSSPTNTLNNQGELITALMMMLFEKRLPNQDSFRGYNCHWKHIPYGSMWLVYLPRFGWNIC